MDAEHYIIYNDPKNHPGKFFVRYFEYGSGSEKTLKVDTYPKAKTDSLREARSMIPLTMKLLDETREENGYYSEIWGRPKKKDA